ncbi:MAG: HAD family phosphatase [Promethearchaeota archaeon]|nr:MAG: HAD family phosphatase [Candidatus Lokiarchaeota archaeon]
MYEKNCVIFDMDGVLADTSSMHFKSWKRLSKKLNVEFTKEFFNNTFGQKSFKIIQKLLKDKFDTISTEKVKEWGELKEKYYRDLIKDKLKPLPGVIPLIKNLRKNNFKLAIGSSGPKENVDLLLDKLKIKRFFDAIITAEDVEIGKPNPEVFLLAAERLEIKQEKSLVIEDSPVGIEAARSARMKVIALTTTHDESELQKADLIKKDLRKLHIREINKLIDIPNEKD